MYSVIRPSNAARATVLRINVGRRTRIGRFVVRIMGLALWIATVAMGIGARVGFVVGVKGLARLGLELRFYSVLGMRFELVGVSWGYDCAGYTP